MTERLPTGLWIVGVAGDLYEDALDALIDALALAGEAHWHAWMVLDREHWRRGRDVSHHRSAYGGMGSFNDLWFASGDQWVDATAETLREAMAEISAAVVRDPARTVQLQTTVAGTVRAGRCTRCATTLVPSRGIEHAAASAWASWWIPTCLRDRRPADICAGATGRLAARREEYAADGRSRLPSEWLVVESGKPGATAGPCPRCSSVELSAVAVALY